MKSRHEHMLRTDEVSDDAEWDDFVATSEGGTVFHSSLWIHASHFAFVRLGVFHNGRLVAGVVFQHKTTDAEKDSLSPYLGPLAISGNEAFTDPRTMRKTGFLLAGAIRRRYPGIEFSSSPWHEELLGFVCHGFHARLTYTSVVDVSNLEAARRRLWPTLKANLRAAGKQELVVESSSDPSEVLSLASLSFRRQSAPIWYDPEEARNCFLRLAGAEQARCFVTYSADGAALAAVGLVWDRRRSYYLLGGHDHTRGHRGAHSLAMWQAMKYTRETLGLAVFDLEGTHIASVDRFFRQFGGSSLPFYYVWEAGS